jgi:hypothetical protein
MMLMRRLNSALKTAYLGMRNNIKVSSNNQRGSWQKEVAKG